MKDFTKAITIAILTGIIVLSVSFGGAAIQKDLDKQYTIGQKNIAHELYKK